MNHDLVPEEAVNTLRDTVDEMGRLTSAVARQNATALVDEFVAAHLAGHRHCQRLVSRAVASLQPLDSHRSHLSFHALARDLLAAACAVGSLALADYVWNCCALGRPDVINEMLQVALSAQSNQCDP